MPVMAGGRDEQAESEHRLEIAAYLDRVISAAGYESQAELARDIGVAPSSVSHWLSRTSERGISAYNMLRVLEAAERRKTGASNIDPNDPIGDRLRLLDAKLDVIFGEIRRLRYGSDAKHAAQEIDRLTGRPASPHIRAKPGATRAKEDP